MICLRISDRGHYGQTAQPAGHVGCCGVGVMHLGGCRTGPSITQQSCPSVQQSLPQHVVVLEQLPPGLLHGDVVQLPPMHVGAAWGQALPQLPQL